MVKWHQVKPFSICYNSIRDRRWVSFPFLQKWLLIYLKLFINIKNSKSGWSRLIFCPYGETKLSEAGKEQWHFVISTLSKLPQHLERIQRKLNSAVLIFYTFGIMFDSILETVLRTSVHFALKFDTKKHQYINIKQYVYIVVSVCNKNVFVHWNNLSDQQ